MHFPTWIDLKGQDSVPETVHHVVSCRQKNSNKKPYNPIATWQLDVVELYRPTGLLFECCRISKHALQFHICCHWFRSSSVQVIACHLFGAQQLPASVLTCHQSDLNSLAPGKFEWNFRHVIFKQILVTDDWGISCEIALIWMSLDFTDDQSTLVQVMAWCRQATSHYLSQCWPRSLSPYNVIRPQWVNEE